MFRATAFSFLIRGARRTFTQSHNDSASSFSVIYPVTGPFLMRRD